MQECLNAGTVQSSYRAGGIVGMWNGNSYISNCENLGGIEVEGAADKTYAAGIATLDSLYSAMSYCLNRGSVSSYASDGIAYAMPLIADLQSHDGRNNYYCSECAVIGEESGIIKGSLCLPVKCANKNPLKDSTLKTFGRWGASIRCFGSFLTILSVWSRRKTHLFPVSPTK